MNHARPVETSMDERWISRGFRPGLLHWTAPQSLYATQILNAFRHGSPLRITAAAHQVMPAVNVAFDLAIDQLGAARHRPDRCWSEPTWLDRSASATDLTGSLLVEGSVMRFCKAPVLGEERQLLTLAQPVPVRLSLELDAEELCDASQGRAHSLWLQTRPPQAVPPDERGIGEIVVSGNFILS